MTEKAGKGEENSPQIEKMDSYSLFRGKIAPEDVSVKELSNLLKDPPSSASKKAEFEKAQKDALKELCEVTKPGDYSSTFHNVFFKTNQSITLESLGFWGPQKELKATYKVTVKMFQLSSITPSLSQTTTFVDKFEDTIEAERRQIFLFQFKQPPLILPNSWIKLEFLLDGPKTSRCESVEMEYEGEGDVMFTFSTSSRQMPIINYKIPSIIKEQKI